MLKYKRDPQFIVKQIDIILVECGNGEITLKKISDMLDWQTGAASAAMGQLVKKGLVEKKRYGYYVATKSGKKRIREIIESEHPPDDIDSVVYRTAALFTADSRFEIIRTFRYGKETKRPSAQTKRLGDVFRKVYVETIHCAHRDKPDFVKSMWRNHEEPVCHDCGFDFEKAYENHKKDINNITSRTPLSHKFSKAKLFKNLRWESFSDSEKYRKNFGMRTLITESKIPDSWHDHT